MNFGNIEYKYVILDKEVKLPNEICDNRYMDSIREAKEIVSYADGNLTYRLENNDTKSLKIPSSCIAFKDKHGDKIKTYNYKNLEYDSRIHSKVSLVEPTYFIKNDEKVELYNIKTLSTIGNSWHIETQNGFRFKLDKKFINTEIQNLDK
ncbi:MAG: hypothetical protein GX282_01610 [Campylobacteraceae bacterium]|nr:hypothetical protein [Campylobacteraceae bacterium]